MTHRNFMIDLETLSTDNDAVILSIGAVEFTLPKFDGPVFNEGSLGREFYQNVDPQSCIDRGMSVNASTVEWWQDQDPAAQQALRANRVHLFAALTRLAVYLVPDDIADDTCTVWAHGDVFDIAILNNAYRLIKAKTPWKYNAVRDARTAYDLTGVWPSDDHNDENHVAHNALSDAKRQARAVIAGVRTVEKLKYDHCLLFRKSVGYEEPADDIMRHIIHNEPSLIIPPPPPNPANVVDFPLTFEGNDTEVLNTDGSRIDGAFGDAHAPDCDCINCRIPF